uniref:Adenylate kinase isoenzyme 5 n=1 Tax=Panagrolaimus sp. PS1159 TaxID=55785 RepID=A0AC35G254_9BILA
MGAEGKRYLQDHSIPQLFEGLMTGLIYNKPENPLDFLEAAIARIRSDPDLDVKWDTFIDTENGPVQTDNNIPGGNSKKPSTKKVKREPSKTSVHSKREISSKREGSSKANSAKSVSGAAAAANSSPTGGMPSAGHQRVPSVTKAADVARIPSDVPIILFIGGPGGGKTRIAARVRDAMEEQGVVHICMPDLVKSSIAKYKDRFPEWKDAAEKYAKGELIPNHLAQDIVKAEMGRHQNAKAYFLEGFPREARQVEEFEKHVRPINMALILDYDEETLRRHMQSRGLAPDVMDRRISEFKQKTLPSAKYFDDQRLLHLIPGEKEDSIILERMKKLISRAIELGVVPVLNSQSNSPTEQNGHATPAPETPAPTSVTPIATAASAAAVHSPPKTAQSVKSPSPLPQSHHSERPPQTAQSTNSAHANHASPPKTAQSQNHRASTGHRTPSASAKPPSGASTPQAEVGNGHPLANLSSTSPNPLSPTPAVVEEHAHQSTTNSPPHSIPPTAGSRPQTQAAEHDENIPPHTRQIPLNERPPSSIASTPRLTEGPFKDAIDPPTSDTTRLMTANADKFPKGLPNNSPVILVIGGPGSNKTIMAQRIAKKYDGFIYLSMGELLRRKVQQNSDDELWQRIGRKMDSGETIPLQICREVIYTAMHEQGFGSWGYCIEGYPRTMRQLEDLEQQLGRLDVALLIDCTEQYCKDNITKRYKEGLENGNQRKDDNEEIVATRLNLFKQNTLPMLKNLDDKGKLRVIDGDNTNLDNVFKEVTNAIDNSIFIQESEGGKSLNSSKHGSVDET